MLLAMLKTLRFLAMATLFFSASMLAYFSSISFVAFQKSIAITPHDLSRLVLVPQPNGPDIRALLQAIPYKNAKMIYDVNPADRFNLSIQLGYGNCSNLAFGLAYYLTANAQDYQIIQIIPYEGFLTGAGHTVVNMTYLLDGSSRSGIVDVLEGGLPKDGDRFLTLQSMMKKTIESPSIYPLNLRKDNTSGYYGDYLQNSAVGVVVSGEVKSYFNFIEKIYFPLGSKKLERIFFNGVALVLGVYPHIYVDQEDYSLLFDKHRLVRLSAEGFLLALRILPVICMFWLLASFIGRIDLGFFSSSKMDKYLRWMKERAQLRLVRGTGNKQ